MTEIQLFPAIEGTSGMYGRHFESPGVGLGRMEVLPDHQGSGIEAYIFNGFYTSPIRFDLASERSSADIIDDDALAVQVARIASKETLKVRYS